MRTILILILLAVAGSRAFALAMKDKSPPVVFNVQLIRGSEEDQPPLPGCKLVTPRLHKCLHAVFKARNFWEINRQKVTMTEGEKAKVALSKKREVEIDLSEAGKRKVSIFQDGQCVSRTIRSAGSATTVIGGDQDATSIWFIVVQRGEPATQ